MMNLYVDCGDCAGEKFTEQMSGGVHTLLPCPTCHGEGYVPVAVDREAIAKTIAKNYAVDVWEQLTEAQRDDWLEDADAVLKLLESGGRG